MVLLLILIVTVSFCLVPITAQDSEELYLVTDLARSKLTCISKDDDAALVWNYDLSTNESSDSLNDFSPAKPKNENISQCAVWRSTNCLASWAAPEPVRVNSLVEPMGPVVDYRWEGFKEEVWSEYTLCSELEYPYTDGTVAFSVRGIEDIRVLFCDSALYRCFVITIAVKGKYSAIQSCDGYRNRNGQPEESHNCHEIDKFEHNAAVLDAHEWRTFRFQWIKNVGRIYVFSDLEKEAFLQGDVHEWQSVCNIRIESTAGARIKLHAYDYIPMKIPGNILTTELFSWNDKNFCVDMLVSLCPQCRIDIRVMGDGSSGELANESISGDQYFGSHELRMWQSIKLHMNLQSPISSRIKLKITSDIIGNDYNRIWWAINDLRSCDQSGAVRDSTIWLQSAVQRTAEPHIKCQKLSHGKIVSVDLLKSKICSDVNQLGACIRQRKKSCFFDCTNFSNVDSNSADASRRKRSEVTVNPKDRHILSRRDRTPVVYHENSLIIYDVDSANNTTSLAWKPPYPLDEIESYHLLLLDGDKIIQRLSTERFEIRYNMGNHFIHILNCSFPAHISTDLDLKLQIRATNRNVTVGEATSTRQFKLNDLYNEDPDEIWFSWVYPTRQKMLKLRWLHNVFSPTKIERYCLRFDCLYTSLANQSCENFTKILPIEEVKQSYQYYIANLNVTSLLPSTRYSIHMWTKNHRNRTSRPKKSEVFTMDEVAFIGSEKELKVNFKEAGVEIKVPAVSNPTMNTTMVVEVEGISLCKLNSSRSLSPSSNDTETVNRWIATDYHVNSSESINFIFTLNQSYGVKQNCFFQARETYVLVVTLKTLTNNLSLRSSPFIFPNEKQTEIWSMIIPILVICLSCFVFYIWYRIYRKALVRTNHSENVLSDALYENTVSVNSSGRTSHPKNVSFDLGYSNIPTRLMTEINAAGNVPIDPIYEIIPESFGKQTRPSENASSDYMIPIDWSVKPTHEVLPDLSYINLPGIQKEQMNHARDIPSNPIYANHSESAGNQTSSSQSKPSEPICVKMSPGNLGKKNKPSRK